MSKSKRNRSNKALARRIAELERRIEAEHGPATSGCPGSDTHPGAAEERALYCSVPPPPQREMEPGISRDRARLVQYRGAKWVNETRLHYYFFDTGPFGAGDDQRDFVREAFQIWKDVGIGLEFEEVTNIEQAEIRIGFLPGDGYWSGIGTHILGWGQHERTMNFGQDLRLDPRGVDVPVHEIGHTLGFPHEHQNPIAGIVWNEPAVIDYFRGPPNEWSMQEIENNILRKIPRSQVDGSDWDRDSIMHYAFEPGLIDVPARYQHEALRPAAGLSQLDREQVRFFYPPAEPNVDTLNLFESVRLSLAPGEQRSLRIRPSASRDYTIQTYGFTDSVMVLFEDIDGVPVFVAGDDDSGWNRNARLQLRLYEGREYIVRIRMYYQWASGDMAVMMY